MLNSMVVGRVKKDDHYDITLEVPAKEYFEIYEDVDKEAAEDILKQYLTYHGDDGKYTKVGIEYHKNINIVSITAELDYMGNDHTEQFTIPNHLSDEI